MDKAVAQLNIEHYRKMLLTDLDEPSGRRSPNFLRDRGSQARGTEGEREDQEGSLVARAVVQIRQCVG
jgi:hypothetical protein